MKCTNKFWIESFKDLFCSFNLAPLPELSLEEQMNALTRMVLVIFIILLVLDYRYDLIFLLLSLIFIILLYYIQKKKMKENFTPQVFTDPNATQIKYSLTYTSTPIQSTPGNSMWRDQDINISDTFNDPNFESINQKLVGQGMARTLVNPIIPPPIADTEYWRPTDFVVPSGINDQKTRELFQSGYAGCTESCVKLAPTCDTTAFSFECNPKENGCYKVENANHHATSQFCNQKCQVKEGYDNEYEEKSVISRKYSCY